MTLPGLFQISGSLSAVQLPLGFSETVAGELIGQTIFIITIRFYVHFHYVGNCTDGAKVILAINCTTNYCIPHHTLTVKKKQQGQWEEVEEQEEEETVSFKNVLDAASKNIKLIKF